MGATASLSEPLVAVVPGGEVHCDLAIRNTGTVVDQFSFEVVGEAAAWAAVDPPSLSLLPGGEGTVRVRFAPPRSPQVAAGPVAFAVHVVPSEDPEGSVAEEGTIEVAPFSEPQAELLPRTSRGRRKGKHELAFDNRGNTRLNATVTAVDPDELLAFDITPPDLVADPGTANFTKIEVRPRKRFLRGAPKTRPFQVHVFPDGEDLAAVTVDGTLLQEPVIPKWLPKALLALLLLALLLLLLWFTLLRPTIESLAREAAEEGLEQAEEAADQAAAAAEQAGAAADQAAVAAEQAAAVEEAVEEQAAAAEEAEGQRAAEEDARRLSDLGVPFDFRLTRSVAPGAERSEPFVVPSDQVLSLTDIVIQNPQGDRGLLQIKRGQSAVLIEIRLENFRDLDYHFVSPVVFTGDQQVVLSVRCENEGATACNPGGYFNGFMKQAAEEEPEA